MNLGPESGFDQRSDRILEISGSKMEINFDVLSILFGKIKLACLKEEKHLGPKSVSDQVFNTKCLKLATLPKEHLY